MTKQPALFPVEQKIMAIDLAVEMVRIAVKVGIGEYSLQLDRGELDGEMTGPWEIIVRPHLQQDSQS